jgi:hypothetical protein
MCSVWQILLKIFSIYFTSTELPCVLDIA